MNAMYFSNKDFEFPKRIGEIESDIKEMFETERICYKYDGAGNLKQVASTDRICQIHLRIPTLVVNTPMFYGEKITTKLAKNIFGIGWSNHSFMFIPGDFSFRSGDLYFEGSVCPGTTSTLLAVSDMPMWGYGGVNNLNTFEIGDFAYGLLVPFARLTGEKGIFAGQCVSSLIREMRQGLKTAIA